MKAEIKNGQLIVTIPVSSNPTASKSGKSLTLASTKGNRPFDLNVNGKQQTVMIGINAYVLNSN